MHALGTLVFVNWHYIFLIKKPEVDNSRLPARQDEMFSGREPCRTRLFRFQRLYRYYMVFISSLLISIQHPSIYVNPSLQFLYTSCPQCVYILGTQLVRISYLFNANHYMDAI